MKLDLGEELESSKYRLQNMGLGGTIRLRINRLTQIRIKKHTRVSLRSSLLYGLRNEMWLIWRSR